MSVYKKGKYFHYDFQFHGVRYTGSTGCTSKRKAEEFEKRTRDDAAVPARQRPAITVDEACGLYREKVETLPSWPTTRYMLRSLVAGLGSNVRLSDVTQRDLQVYLAKRRKGRKPATLNREIDVARAVWEHADKTRFDVGDKPDWRALKLKDTARIDRELSVDEEQRLFVHLRADVCDAVDFLLKSGWRRNEVLNLRWVDCNLEARVCATKIKGGDVVRRPLNDTLAEIIRRQPRVCEFVFTFVCQRPSKNRRRGQRYHLTPTALRSPFGKALADAKITGFRLHDLRHTRATRIVRSTGSLIAAKGALAHRSITTTQRYAHVLDDDTRNALDASESRNSPEA
ncbi:tyrosine-type recombinase/integrase [Novosphingobium huizhouense]|uniref:tyrosine-type recombinase/integrase n=1 Tax=Novosphingobium huizhouense TaxID=2866625 RepID=UPI001CD86577|nr:site-specific integrase [Novosphingobium huizhouense]